MDKGLMLATQSGELNLNIDQKTLDACLKSINGFTHITYQNICTGQSVSVPTGPLDYFFFFVFVLPFGILVLVGVAKFLHIVFLE